MHRDRTRAMSEWLVVVCVLNLMYLGTGWLLDCWHAHFCVHGYNQAWLHALSYEIYKFRPGKKIFSFSGFSS